MHHIKKQNSKNFSTDGSHENSCPRTPVFVSTATASLTHFSGDFQPLLK